MGFILPSIQGIQGPQGIQGVQGIQGIPGATGPQGNPGVSPPANTFIVNSTSTNTLGSGSKTFTFPSTPYLGWMLGVRLRAIGTANNYMEGNITSVLPTSVTMNIDYVVGSGTYSSWTIGLTGDKGSDGINGAPGAPGATGAPGANGAGVPVGGTSGQVLSKVDGTDYNTQWISPSGGGAIFSSHGNISIGAPMTNVTVRSFGVTAGTYRVIYNGQVQTNGTASTGRWFQFGGPAGTTFHGYYHTRGGANSFNEVGCNNVAINTSITTTNTTSTLPLRITFDGVFTVINSGTIDLKFQLSNETGFVLYGNLMYIKL